MKRGSRGEKQMKEAIRNCSECEWCQSLEDNFGRTIWFCMCAFSPGYLDETDLLGNCTIEVPEGDESWEG